jgi:two-component system, OmpR family, copper resistance phosphate regulon response regulator CusR
MRQAGGGQPAWRRKVVNCCMSGKETCHILLVEDEQKIADTLRLGLEEQGFATDLAYDGTIGWRLFDTRGFDLVILDINLPGINGYELCQRIRRKDQQVPVIMLTALSSLNDKIEGYDAGADDYVIKPFEFRELLMKVRVLLRRTRNQVQPTGNILKAEDLEMNLDTKEVRRAEVAINLTAKEFQLLEYLLRNKNRVVSRADIAIHVWDIDFDTNTNVIDVYINYVRNKVDKPFPRKLIQTQVGMGYVLKENS